MVLTEVPIFRPDSTSFIVFRDSCDSSASEVCVNFFTFRNTMTLLAIDFSSDNVFVTRRLHGLDFTLFFDIRC